MPNHRRKQAPGFHRCGDLLAADLGTMAVLPLTTAAVAWDDVMHNCIELSALGTLFGEIKFMVCSDPCEADWNTCFGSQYDSFTP